MAYNNDEKYADRTDYPAIDSQASIGQPQVTMARPYPPMGQPVYGQPVPYMPNHPQHHPQHHQYHQHAYNQPQMHPYGAPIPMHNNSSVQMGIPMQNPTFIVSVQSLPYYPAESTIRTPVPIRVKCNICGNIGVTRIGLKAGKAAWGWCLVMAFSTGCCCIPFFIDGCQDKHHVCSSCGAQVGVFEANMC